MAGAGGPHPCRADEVAVGGYYRTPPRRRRKLAQWWECVSASGRRCGRHHASLNASLGHARQLNRQARKQDRRWRGKLDMYEPEEHKR